MVHHAREESEAFRALPREVKERLHLEILMPPPLRHRGSWGEWLQAWLEDEAATGRSLGAIAARMDYPHYDDAKWDEPWDFLERHVAWLIARGYARVVCLEPLH